MEQAGIGLPKGGGGVDSLVQIQNDLIPCSQFHIFPLPIFQNWINFMVPYSQFHIRPEKKKEVFSIRSDFQRWCSDGGGGNFFCNF